MSEYITKGQALYVASYAANTGNLKRAQKLIDVAPPADVVQVVRGEWIESDHRSYICSVCGEDWVLPVGTPKENDMNYCSFCGAKMDGE